MAKPIKLFYWPTPNGWKISIALEEFGLPFDCAKMQIHLFKQYLAQKYFPEWLMGEI